MIYITTDLIGLIMLGIGLFMAGILLGGYFVYRVYASYDKDF